MKNVAKLKRVIYRNIILKSSNWGRIKITKLVLILLTSLAPFTPFTLIILQHTKHSSRVLPPAINKMQIRLLQKNNLNILRKGDATNTPRSGLEQYYILFFLLRSTTRRKPNDMFAWNFDLLVLHLFSCYSVIAKSEASRSPLS